MPKSDTEYYVWLHGKKGFVYNNIYYEVPYYTAGLKPCLLERKHFMFDEDGNLYSNFRRATDEEIAAGIDPLIDEYKKPDHFLDNMTWVEYAEEEINRKTIT